MNNKQKVLKILEKHRDMSLSFGCEVYHPVKKLYWKIACDISSGYKGDEYMRHLKSVNEKNELYKCGSISTMLDEYKILGHPATPLTLLKALPEHRNAVMNTKDGILYYYCPKGSAEIPLVTTLTELPHTHKLWTDLLPILS